MVVRAGHGEEETARRALEDLCRDYWQPLFEFARRVGNNPEAAQDLTQGFFAQLLATESVARADQGRGRFRSFLLGAFRNFMNAEYRARTAAKRGGSVPPAALDSLPEGGRQIADELGSPEREYDRAWAFTLLERVLRELAAEYERAGRGELFASIRPLLAAGSAPPGYAALGARVGLSEGAAAVAVHRMRKRYGALLRAAIADTVADPADIDDELRHLIGIVAESPGGSASD